MKYEEPNMNIILLEDGEISTAGELIVGSKEGTSENSLLNEYNFEVK